MRELLYLSRTKLNGFSPPRGVLGKVKPNVEVSLPGVTIGAAASDRPEPSTVPWDRLKAVEKHLRKTSVEIDSPDLGPGTWFRFHCPMLWAVSPYYARPEDRLPHGEAALFASVDIHRLSGVTRLILTGSKGHLLADGGSTPVRYGPSAAAPPSPQVRAEKEKANRKWMERLAASHLDWIGNAASAYSHIVTTRTGPVGMSGYARVLGISTDPQNLPPNWRNHHPPVERFILGTPLMVEYARMP